MHRFDRPRMAWLVALVALAFFGCDVADEHSHDTDEHAHDTGDGMGGASASGLVGGVWTPLVDSRAWRETDRGDDPWMEHRPDVVSCAEGTAVEGTSFEVSTTSCNYLSVSQPLQRTIARGDASRIRVWWQNLNSDVPAEGHWALTVGSTVLWEDTIAIPGPPDTRSVEFVSPREFPAGTVINLHLHNHGANTWTFGEWSVYADGN